jgi:hypothetical protein
VPAGIVASVASLTAYGLAFYASDLTLRQSRTSATLVLSAVGLWVLVCLARPFNWWRTVLVAAMVLSIAVILFVPALRNFYALQVPDADIVAEMDGDRRDLGDRDRSRVAFHPTVDRAPESRVRGRRRRRLTRRSGGGCRRRQQRGPERAHVDGLGERGHDERVLVRHRAAPVGAEDHGHGVAVALEALEQLVGARTGEQPLGDQGVDVVVREVRERLVDRVDAVHLGAGHRAAHDVDGSRIGVDHEHAPRAHACISLRAGGARKMQIELG